MVEKSGTAVIAVPCFIHQFHRDILYRADLALEKAGQRLRRLLEISLVLLENQRQVVPVEIIGKCVGVLERSSALLENGVGAVERCLFRERHRTGDHLQSTLLDHARQFLLEFERLIVRSIPRIVVDVSAQCLASGCDVFRFRLIVSVDVASLGRRDLSKGLERDRFDAGHGLSSVLPKHSQQNS